MTMGSIGALVPILGMLIAIVAIVMANWRRVQMRRLEIEARGLGETGALVAERLRA